MIDYRQYPPNWKTEIRPRILARAGQLLTSDGAVLQEARCEWCRAENRARGVRYPNGNFEPGEVALFDPGTEGARIVTIILTIAHLDHDKDSHQVDDSRLAALCQRCHLNYDRNHHLEVQRDNRERRKGPLLFSDLPAHNRE